MYVKAKDLTLSAVCLAISMILILAESVLSISTLFLLSLAGFLIGIVIREVGLKFGFVYFIASFALSFILAPDKIKLVIFLGAEIYLLLRELAWEYLEKREKMDIKRLKLRYFLAKLFSFNLLFVPFLSFFPELIMPHIDNKWKIMIFLFAQPVWYLFDVGYDHFQVEIWNRIKHKK